MNAVVFLDRDNTIIHNDGDLGDPEQVRLIQGAASAIASLRGLNYKIVVVTNQGGVARGKYTEDDVQKTNQRVADLVKAASGATIDRFYYCPYHPQGTVPEYTAEHDWRKPAPGMLLQAARDMRIDMSQSWMVGDHLRDVQAGVAAGVRSILLRDDAQELQPLRGDQLKAGKIETTGQTPHFTARNLIEAVRIIAQQRKPEAQVTHEPPPRRKWDAAAVKAAREGRQTPPAATTSHPTEAALPATAPTPAASPSAAPPPIEHDPPDMPGHASAAPVVAPTPAASPPVAPAPQDGAAVGTPPAQPMITSSTRRKPQAFRPPGASWQATPTAPAMPAAPTAPAQPVPAGHAPSAPAPAMADDGPEMDAAASQRTPPGDVTLRQILQELRNQRQAQHDFSYGRMIAIVLQILAGFLLLAGFMLGAQDMDAFLRWAVTATLAQLAAIAMLLMAR